MPLWHVQQQLYIRYVVVKRWLFAIGALPCLRIDLFEEVDALGNDEYLIHVVQIVTGCDFVHLYHQVNTFLVSFLAARSHAVQKN
jgi:hypothetical protein